MAATEAGRLRLLLGEVVPPGGTEADTLFTDAQINDLVTAYPVETDAAREGWRIKAAMLANLVNTAESGASRSMSDLHKNALAMWKSYGGEAAQADTGTPGRRVRSKRIVRSDYTE